MPEDRWLAFYHCGRCHTNVGTKINTEYNQACICPTCHLNLYPAQQMSKLWCEIKVVKRRFYNRSFFSFFSQCQNYFRAIGSHAVSKPAPTEQNKWNFVQVWISMNKFYISDTKLSANFISSLLLIELFIALVSPYLINTLCLHIAFGLVFVYNAKRNWF